MVSFLVHCLQVTNCISIVLSLCRVFVPKLYVDGVVALLATHSYVEQQHLLEDLGDSAFALLVPEFSLELGW